MRNVLGSKLRREPHDDQTRGQIPTFGCHLSNRFCQNTWFTPLLTEFLLDSRFSQKNLCSSHKVFYCSTKTSQMGPLSWLCSPLRSNTGAAPASPCVGSHQRFRSRDLPVQGNTRGGQGATSALQCSVFE